MVASATMEQFIVKPSNESENRNAYTTASLIPKCLKRKGKIWLITFYGSNRLNPKNIAYVHFTTVQQNRRSLCYEHFMMDCQDHRIISLLNTSIK